MNDPMKSGEFFLTAKKLLAFEERYCSKVGLLVACERLKASLVVPLPDMDSLLPCNFWRERFLW
jgi:hypothetical protein